MKANTSIYTACSKKEILCSDLLDLPFPRPIQPRCWSIRLNVVVKNSCIAHFSLLQMRRSFSTNSAVEICCDGLGIQGLGRDLGKLGSYM